jgi:hypothetical protein
MPIRKLSVVTIPNSMTMRIERVMSRRDIFANCSANLVAVNAHPAAIVTPQAPRSRSKRWQGVWNAAVQVEHHLALIGTG